MMIEWNLYKCSVAVKLSVLLIDHILLRKKEKYGVHGGLLHQITKLEVQM